MPTSEKVSKSTITQTQSSDSFFRKAGDKAFFSSAPDQLQVQPKLEVSSPHDPLEVEADKVADSVMQSSNIQRKCDACEEEKIDRKEFANTLPFTQAKQSTGASDVPVQTAQAIQSSKGAGAQMDQDLQSNMSNQFGTDFSNVKIHTGHNAIQLSEQLNAKAFTTGADIYFNQGQYNPQSSEGKHLLAHELTHVVQQKSAPSIQRQAVPVPTATPTPAPVPWSRRVSDASFELDPDTAFINLIREAIGTATTIHSATNSAVSVDAAITAGNYTPWNATNMTINYDANFNNKTGIGSGPYGETIYKTNNGTQVYIILGPNAVKSFGPEYTQMANAHEQAHARDFASQGASPHAATNTEELTIYTQGFINYFLPLVRLDVPNCSYDFGESFDPLFERYTAANTADRNRAFANIQTFYTGSIAGNTGNLLKFKVWLQDNMNRRSATNALARRLNTDLSVGLTRGTNPATHITGCAAP